MSEGLDAEEVGKSALVVVLVLGLMSLAVAFVLFYYLESVAQIEDNNIKLGGGFAGFVVTFWLANRSYSQIRASTRIRGGRKLFKDTNKINEYMKKFISKGSAVDIVSNHLSWVSTDESVKKTIINYSKKHTLTIYLPADNAIAKELRDSGVSVRVIPALSAGPKARFTLLNKDTPGSGLLAVGFGTIPKFEIAEFPEGRHPQIVALARDYITSLATIANQS